MSALDFRRLPVELLDERWRALDCALARWVLAHGGSPLLARVAAWASLADGSGDTALPLSGELAGRHGMPRLTDAELLALRGEPMVASPEAPETSPFVLDADDRFYLRRNHADECAVAAAIMARRAAGLRVEGRSAPLDDLFAGTDPAAVAEQREAVRKLPGRRLFVLTGGPGTGKTSTVLRMLLNLQRQADASLRVALAAPTGKAAQRLSQSLRDGRRMLARNPALATPVWQACIRAIPDGGAQTLHRLLDFDPRRGRYAWHRERPLPADVVVVDEASMVDLALLRALLAAVPPASVLILVGDADQLTSIGAGSVLMDLVAAFERGADRSRTAGTAPTADLVRLSHSFRSVADLAAVNEAVRRGDAAAFDLAWRTAAERVQRLRIDGPQRLAQALDDWSRQLAERLARPTVAMPDPLADPAGGHPDRAAGWQVVSDALSRLRERQLLCALREGRFGTVAINAAIERRLRQHWHIAAAQSWFPGRIVMITENDYGLRLFNGDIGLCLRDDAGQLRVWFESADTDTGSTVRGLAVGTLPRHEPAYAITIHKSQGSEYRHAAVVLPPDGEHRILSRQLLYTGLSRAKESLALWATDEALARALAQPVRRAGGLLDRLTAAGLPVANSGDAATG